MEVQLVTEGAAYQHGAAFALGIIVAFLISVLTQVYKDPDRFMKKDFDERIELVKITLKLQAKQQMKRQAAVEMTAEGRPSAIQNVVKQRITQQQIFDLESNATIPMESQVQVTESVMSSSSRNITKANLPKNRKMISKYTFAE